MVWNLNFPLVKNWMNIQIWDKDLLSPNDFISEETISFDKIARLAYLNN